MKKTIACILIAILLVGCSNEINYTENYISSDNRFIRTNKDVARSNEVWGYLIDKETGVVYLEYNESRAHAITVMLNADGTPVIRDQLGLEVNE